MDSTGSSKQITNMFRNNIINQIITFLIIVTSIYISIAAITGQHVFHPLLPVTSKSLDLRNAANEILHSIISCFLIVTPAIIFGKLAKIFYIPSVIGFILVGVVMRNVPYLYHILAINSYWQLMLRKLSLIVIIIRWGLSVDARFIVRNSIFPSLLGIMSASCEALSIFIVSHFIFKFPASISLICGFVVGTVSPAISVPPLIRLKERGIGTEKNIPDIVPAACCFDNIFSIFIFSLTAASTFTNDSIFPILIKNVGAICLSIVLGAIIGWLIRWFPKTETRHTHLARFLIIFFCSTGIIISMLVLGYQFCGIVACLALCVVSGTHWREDNPEGIKLLVHQYSNVWNFLAAPLLFSLVGFTFDCSKISLNDVSTTLWIIAAGSITRLISAMIISYFGNFNIREQFIIAISLIPKATVQCALAPSLIYLATDFPQLTEVTRLVINISIISVIITSPIAEILLKFLAPVLLKSKPGFSVFDSNYISNVTTTNRRDSLTVFARREDHKINPTREFGGNPFFEQDGSPHFTKSPFLFDKNNNSVYK